ncbi:MAG: hypothetical protein IPO21_15030 [Bacteroidales bacterium]|nr:hypothetical protein [Bacteroidales bacterium]
MGKTQTIYHQGLKIFQLDLSNLKTPEEIGVVLKESKSFIQTQPKASVFSLVNVNGMHFNNKVKEMLIDVVKSNKPYVKASAVVGVNGLLQVMFNGFLTLTGREVKTFSTVDEAKNWLYSKRN